MKPKQVIPPAPKGWKRITITEAYDLVERDDAYEIQQKSMKLFMERARLRNGESVLSKCSREA